jgi:hypothetical protein
MSENTVVSYSKIKAWRFCRQNYFFKYNERIVPRMKPKPLKMGSLIHSCLESLARGEHWGDVIVEARKEYEKMFAEEKEIYGNYPEEALRVMEGYVRTYPEKLIKTSLPEEEFGPIPLTDKTSFLFKIDRLVEFMNNKEFKGDKFLMETKTGKRIPKDDMRVWDLQTVVYVWGLRQCGHKIRGIVWDYLRTKAPTVPEVLKSGGLSQNKNIDTDYHTYYTAILDHGGDPDNYKEFLESLRGNEQNFYRRIIVPVSDSLIESILEDVRNTSTEIHYLGDSSCIKTISGFTCPRCDYNSICYAQLRGLDEQFIRKADFVIREKEEEVKPIEEEE